MKRKTLGRTDLSVSRIGLGSLYLQNAHATFEDAAATVEFALEKGINYFDTAPAYGNSEEVLGNALRGRDGKIILSTKIGGRPQPFNPKDKHALIDSVSQSLENLRTDYIDILYIHEPDRVLEYDWWTDTLNYEGPVLDAIDEMKRQGMIRYSGLGGTTARELARVCDSGKFDVVLTAFNFSPLFQEARYEIFPTAKKHNMGVVCGSVMQAGVFSVRHDREVLERAPWLSLPRKNQILELYRLVDEIQMSLPELALRFALSCHDVDCILTGANTPSHLEENLIYAKRGPLEDDILDRVEEIYMMVPFRPALEYFVLPFGETCKGQKKFY